MLSIAIPTYRYDVRPLVAELLRQVATMEEPVEILVYDDASPDDGDWGRAELRTTPGIHYLELKKNLGRAAIRNKLAKEATQEYVVMMDADGKPPANFIGCYLDAVVDHQQALGANQALVCVGGRRYQDDPPGDQTYHLHWWYGQERESPGPVQRQGNGWLGFQSNNFLVSRALLLAHPFDETHTGYGHEDTLWGQQFAGQHVQLRHPDNPVVHLGLEPNHVFLSKQKEAIRNLRLLHQTTPHLRTRLIDLLVRFPVLPALANTIPEAWLKAYLTNRKRPSLYALDLLKLKWWMA
jgi:glycosyltransferase involved in cell wall biosynthesis